MRVTIQAAAPEAVEAIEYRLPTFVLDQNLVHFGAFRNHVGFNPTSSGIEHFAEELRDFAKSRGAVQFPHDRPLSLELVRKIVEFRIGVVRIEIAAEAAQPAEKVIRSVICPCSLSSASTAGRRIGHSL